METITLLQLIIFWADTENDNVQLRGSIIMKGSDGMEGGCLGRIFNLRCIFVRMNIDHFHWTSAVIYMREKRIQYYDSLGGSGMVKLQGLLRYLEDEHMAKKGKMLDVGEWELVGCTRDTPQQINGKLSWPMNQ